VTERTKTANPRRRILLIGVTLAGGIGLAAAAVPFVASMEPSARAKAAGAPVDVDIGKIEPGMQITVRWRGKPVWILHRTEDMLRRLGGHDALLRDPDSVEAQQPPYCKNATRSIRPSHFVVIGICTHLGCSPTLREDVGAPDLGADWPGGYLCPCHGSKFDLAGRVFKDMPAPLNLVVPRHRYLGQTRLLIGVDAVEPADS
jgi:ubiquinol-cytochrome c reductase iron-sulfur subunit